MQPGQRPHTPTLTGAVVIVVVALLVYHFAIAKRRR